jgi:hypothetical protein
MNQNRIRFVNPVWLIDRSEMSIRHLEPELSNFWKSYILTSKNQCSGPGMNMLIITSSVELTAFSNRFSVDIVELSKNIKILILMTWVNMLLFAIIQRFFAIIQHHHQYHDSKNWNRDLESIRRDLSQHLKRKEAWRSEVDWWFVCNIIKLHSRFSVSTWFDFTWKISIEATNSLLIILVIRLLYSSWNHDKTHQH